MMALQIVGRFLLQMVIGALLFAAVALVSVALWAFTGWLGNQGVPYHISFVTGLMAQLVFYLDVLCFGVFVIGEAIGLIRDMITSWRDR